MDEQVVRRDKKIRELSDQFINVRLIKCNHLDLKLFQIDWDLTFGVVFINADKTIYARYGTRNSMKADDDVAIEGLAATMQRVLELHSDHPNNKDELQGKQPTEIKQSIPEDFASLDHFKPNLDYQGKVAKSCIHCHQVRDAARLEFRTANQPLPEKLLYPFPSPQVLGIFLDNKTQATISKIEPGSIATKADLKTGDQVIALNNQSIDSEADFRWMLHNMGNETAFTLSVLRKGNRRNVTVPLSAGWRANMDLSWRPTSWDLRRMATGGITLIPLDEKQRDRAGIDEGQMALRINHVGQYGNHARAKRAGLRKNDIITSFDGQTKLLTEEALIEHALQKRKPGDAVEIGYLRNGKSGTTRIRLQ